MGIGLHLTWDSRHFGLQMAQIESLYVFDESPLVRYEAGSALLTQLCHEERERGTRYLFIKSNAWDTPLTHALEDAGFRLVVTNVTSFIRAHDVEFERFPRLCLVRDAHDEDIPVLTEIARRGFGSQTGHDRFHADWTLSKARSDDLMAQWVANSFHGFADFVLTAEKHDQPVGFMTANLQRDLWERLGYSVSSFGVGAVSPAAKGAFMALVMEVASRLVARGARAVEMTTQIGNLEVHNTWEALGIRVCRSHHVFRKWLA